VFTGLVQQLGTVLKAEARDPMRLEIGLERELEDLALGESVALDGVCLTVAGLWRRCAAFDVSHETLARTTLGRLGVGTRVHIERALSAASLLGGHLVQGHVDGVGTVRSVRPVQGSVRLEVVPPAELLRYMVPLGSIAVSGVSLTILELNEAFAVNLVPHTLERTKLGTLRPGSQVNLEADLLAKYLERLLQPYRAPAGVTEELLRRQGYA
jgi:riboflavin synthase